MFTTIANRAIQLLLSIGKVKSPGHSSHRVRTGPRGHHRARLLPSRLAYLAARLCTRLLDIAVPKLRRIAERISRSRCRSWTATPQADYRRCIQKPGAFVAGFLPLSRPEPRQHWRVDPLRRIGTLSGSQSEGPGILVATAHLGKLGAQRICPRLLTEPMGVMVRPLDNPLIDALVEKYRAFQATG